MREADMIIQIDSREKARAIRKIVAEFERQGIRHPVSKLMVGDYMSYDTLMSSPRQKNIYFFLSL